MTPCKPITNKSNQFSCCSWPFTPEADWANRRLTDRLNDCPFHSCIDYPFCGDCLILWWINLRLRLVMVISDGFWMAVCLFSDLIPAFSFTTVIVLDFLNLKISFLSVDADSLTEIILWVCVIAQMQQRWSSWFLASCTSSDFNLVAALEKKINKGCVSLCLTNCVIWIPSLTQIKVGMER